MSRLSLLIFPVLLLLLLIPSQVRGKTYERCELARELQERHAIPYDDLPHWLCLLFWESGYDTKAYRVGNYDGSRNYGIFQINDVMWCSASASKPNNKAGREWQSTNPVGNFKGTNFCNTHCDSYRDNDLSDDVKCAKMIQKMSGFHAWGTYETRCKGDPSVYVEGCDLRVNSTVTSFLAIRSALSDPANFATHIVTAHDDHSQMNNKMKSMVQLHKVAPSSDTSSLMSIFGDGAGKGDKSAAGLFHLADSITKSVSLPDTLMTLMGEMAGKKLRKKRQVNIKRSRRSKRGLYEMLFGHESLDLYEGARIQAFPPWRINVSPDEEEPETAEPKTTVKPKTKSSEKSETVDMQMIDSKKEMNYFHAPSSSVIRRPGPRNLDHSPEQLPMRQVGIALPDLYVPKNRTRRHRVGNGKATSPCCNSKLPPQHLNMNGTASIEHRNVTSGVHPREGRQVEIKRTKRGIIWGHDTINPFEDSRIFVFNPLCCPFWQAAEVEASNMKNWLRDIRATVG